MAQNAEGSYPRSCAQLRPGPNYLVKISNIDGREYSQLRQGTVHLGAAEGYGSVFKFNDTARVLGVPPKAKPSRQALVANN